MGFVEKWKKTGSPCPKQDIENPQIGKPADIE